MQLLCLSHPYIYILFFFFQRKKELKKLGCVGGKTTREKFLSSKKRRKNPNPPIPTRTNFFLVSLSYKLTSAVFYTVF